MFLHLKSRKKKTFRYGKLSDEKLIAKYRETGNMELIAELFDRYTHLVYGICLKYLVIRDHCKDAVMEIFESLFEKLMVHEITSFKNWLYTVTRNYCLMYRRRESTICTIRNNLARDMRQESDAQIVDEPVSNKFDGFSCVEAHMLMKAVAHLNKEQNICLRFLYLESRSYKDISIMTGYSMNKVKSCVQNGKRNLKNYLIKHYGNKKIRQTV